MLKIKNKLSKKIIYSRLVHKKPNVLLKELTLLYQRELKL